MEIGKRIQQARLKAGLTQEEAAEKLNVSRQTISNWENERTYPDIITIITMSDIYKISLDDLLKEKEQTMEDKYLDYLKESVDTVNSKNKLAKTIIVVSYLVIWLALILTFYFVIEGSDAMGFSLMALYIVLPLATMIYSYIIGYNNYFGKKKWYLCIGFALMYMLMEYCTFSISNMVACDKFKMPEFGLLVPGILLAAIPMGLAQLLRKNRKEKAEDINQSQSVL